MDETLLSIPPEHRDRIVRELIDEANQLAAQYEQMTARVPEVFKKIGEGLTFDKE